MNLQRNKPCWCGSGKKYKKCHYPLGPHDHNAASNQRGFLSKLIPSVESDEDIRRAQQGDGRPIVSLEHAGHRFVATGDTLHYSKTWRTFADFLFDYVKKVFGPEWGNEELKKPLQGRHTILQWYDHVCKFQKTAQKDPTGLYSAKMTGGVICYLGMAYSLYLLKHNVELQEVLLARLKDQRQFQGAYYELIVANILIRAGFELELEDEADTTQKRKRRPRTIDIAGSAPAGER